MTELERKALLGDTEAQKQCTEQGIILPCPFCGGEAEIQEELKDRKTHEVTFYCGKCMLELTFIQYLFGGKSLNPSPLMQYNTRHAPPIGNCEDCQYFGKSVCKKAAPHHVTRVSKSFYCKDFKPKEYENA